MANFFVKNRFQKNLSLYQEILTHDILSDVCQKITGSPDFTVDFDDSGYNIGRLAILEHNNVRHFVSFSVNEVTARNSSFQSFVSALIRFHQDPAINKTINFYFLPNNGGNIETPYFQFNYRLMKTAGTRFLNEEFIREQIIEFTSAEDLIRQKNEIRDRSRGNNSTYITKNEENKIQIYGKTYGASKYETSLICLAIANLKFEKIELIQIEEGGLTLLPEIARQVIENIGSIELIVANAAYETREFTRNDSLRSPKYIYNLLDKLGSKRCAICNCEIPQIIHGAHIWPVSKIKLCSDLTEQEKIGAAVDRDNGLWLCSNHHLLFDGHLIAISNEGRFKIVSNLPERQREFIDISSRSDLIDGGTLTPKFLGYLRRRNENIDFMHYE